MRKAERGLKVPSFHVPFNPIDRKRDCSYPFTFTFTGLVDKVRREFSSATRAVTRRKKIYFANPRASTCIACSILVWCLASKKQTFASPRLQPRQLYKPEACPASVLTSRSSLRGKIHRYMLREKYSTIDIAARLVSNSHFRRSVEDLAAR